MFSVAGRSEFLTWCRDSRKWLSGKLTKLAAAYPVLIRSRRPNSRGISSSVRPEAWFAKIYHALNTLWVRGESCPNTTSLVFRLILNPYVLLAKVEKYYIIPVEQAVVLKQITIVGSVSWGRVMSAMRFAASLIAATFVGACGLRIPELQEIPGDTGAGQILVQDIVQSVHCEVADAVQWVVQHDLDNHRKNPRQPMATAFLATWGVQMTLSLTVEEKSTGNPTVVFTPVSPANSVFTLAAIGTLSSDATRIDKLNFYYTIRQLLDRHYCTPGIQHGSASSLLIQNNLRTVEWLNDYVSTVSTGETDPKSVDAFKQNVLSHEVRFEVISSGGISPAWKLTRATIDQTGTLFATSRDRTHDLTVTFGPGDSKGLTGQAALAAFQASLIGLEISNHLRPLP